MNSIFDVVFTASRQINDGRDYHDVLTAIVEEVGELATEIAIDSKHKKREPGPDGIVGESLDVMIAAADMLYLTLVKHGFVTEEELLDMVQKKVNKWLDKSSVDPNITIV